MRRYALAVVVSASDPAHAQRFVGDMLAAGVRWDRPLEVHHVGEGCEAGEASAYATEEIHLLGDGMRRVLRPDRPGSRGGEGGR